jgi:predicted PurR-regulated permease PerM
MDGTLTNRGLLRAVLVAFALVLAYRFVAAVAAMVLLLALGLLLAVALSAPVEALHRRKVPRPVGVLLIVAIFFALLGFGGYLFLPVLAEQASQLASSLPDALGRLVERARELAHRFGIKVSGGGDGISPSTLARAVRRVLGGALGLFSGLAAFVTGLIVVLFVPIYLAALPGPVVEWIVRLFAPSKRDKTRRILSEVRSSLLGWLGGRLISMAIVGVLSAVALYIIGIPGALFLGIFSGLVAFVPLLGSIAGAIPPLLLAFAGNPLDALWVVVAYVLIQQVESNLLTPLVMEKAVSLHPVVVIASVTVAGAAFGVLGALLAVPASVVAGILVEELWFRRLEGGSEASE